MLNGNGLSELVLNSIHQNRNCAVSPIYLLLFSLTARMTLTTSKKQKENAASILKVCSDREDRFAYENDLLKMKLHALEQLRYEAKFRKQCVPIAMTEMMTLPD